MWYNQCRRKLNHLLGTLIRHPPAKLVQRRAIRDILFVDLQLALDQALRYGLWETREDGGTAGWSAHG